MERCQSTEGRRPLSATVRKAVWACAAIVTALPLMGGHAAAQAILEEIVITAEFREARVQDTPIAITAVTGDMLEARSQTNIFEVTRQAPNVVLTPADQAEGAGMIAFIRGIGQTDFNFALEPGVGIYVDDVYYPTLIGSLIELVDIERVEVLRGPQGTLAGRNSIGGAIKIHSQKPTGEGGGMVELTTGSYERIDVKGMANFALADDLFLRIAGISRNRDGYVKRVDYQCTHPDSGVPTFNTGEGCQLGTLGAKSFTAGRVMLRWVPSNDVEVLLIGDLTNDGSEAGPQVLQYANHPGTTADGIPFLRSTIDGTAIPNDCRFVPFGENSCDDANDPYLSYATFIDPREPTDQAPYKPVSIPIINQIDDYGVSGTIDWTISPDFSLKSITAWREYQNSWGSNVTGSPVPVRMLRQTIKHHQWSEEIRLNGTVMDNLVDFTVGGFWFEQGGTLEARVDLNYAGIDFIHGPDTTPSTSKAAFGHVNIHATDRLDISGGLRYSRDKKTYTYFRRNPDHTVPSAPCDFAAGPPTAEFQPPNCLLLGLFNISDSFKGDRLDWRAVLNYRWSDQFMTYAQVSTGYKSGGVNPRPFFGPAVPELNQLHAFEPETLRSYEVGFKSDLFDNRMRLNAAAFFNEYSDIILTLLACPISPCLQPRNIGAADVKGFEVETEIQPVENFFLDGSLSYIDFDYTETDFDVTNITLDMVTPYTPEWKWSIGAQYDIPLASGALVSARFDGSYTSHIFSEPINDPDFNKIAGYFLANARLTWRSPDEDWVVALAVENVTDKLYYHSQEEEASPSSSAHVSANPGLPRTWALTVRRNF